MPRLADSDAAATVRPRLRLPEQALFGREAELARLQEALAQVTAGRRRRFVLVCGEEGIGKSRLVERLHQLCEQRMEDIHLLWGRCDDPGLPYDGLQRLLRARYYIPLHAHGEQAQRALLDGVRATLRNPVADDLAHLIAYLLGFPWAQSATYARYDDDPARILAAARRALAQLLARDAQREPLVLVLEDLHKASAETLALLRGLDEELAEAPILWLGLVTTPCDLEARAPWLLEGARAEALTLTPLADKDARALIAGALRSPQGALPEALLEWVCARAMGHPLRLLRTLEALAQQGALALEGSGCAVDLARLAAMGAPEGGDALERAHLEGLDPDAARLLGLAALQGEEFWLEGVQALDRARAPFPAHEEAPWHGEARDAQVQAIFDALIERDLLRRRDQDQDPLPALQGLFFKHGLERRLALEAIPAPERAALHRQVAHWLTLTASSPGQRGPLLERIADHFLQGERPHEAARLWIEAAQRAAAQHRHASARALLGRALVHLPEDALCERLELLLQLGSAHEAAGDAEAALGRFTEALTEAWRLGARGKAAAALNKTGRVHRRQGRYSAALAQLERALALFEAAGDDAGVAASVSDIGQIFAAQGHYDEAERRFQRALALRRALEDPRSEALELHHLGTIYLGRGDFKEALQMLRQALALRRAQSDRAGVARTLNNLAAICHQRGDMDQARALYQEAAAIADDIDDLSLRGVLHNNLGEIALAQGELARAQEHLTLARDLTQGLGERPTLFDTLRNLGQLSLRRGDLAQAVQHGEEALSLARAMEAPERVGVALRSLAQMYAATLFDLERRQEHAALAERYFQESLQTLERVGNAAELGHTRAAYGNFLLEQGQLVQGRKHLEMARAIFERLDMRRPLEKTDQLIGEL